MNELQKMFAKKKTENGDLSYNTTGDNLTDLFFMTPYFEKHLDQVHIGQSDKEKLFSMYVRDPRFGLGRRDLGRELMRLSQVPFYDVVLAGRYDDLWHNPTDENLNYLRTKLNENDQLAKKWMPRLTGKDSKYAKALCKIWSLSEKEYRKLIKTDSTTEYKLSYAEKQDGSPLNELFNSNNYSHPLVDNIIFEQVPSLAMKKYLHTFSTRDDLKDRFDEYMQQVKQNKKKINVSTANVVDAKDVVGDWCPQDYSENQEIFASKIIDNATLGVDVNAIVILDTSGSMGWQESKGSLLWKAEAIAHAISTHSNYAKNQLISFSSRPRLMTIKGNTLQQQYHSMYTGDCSNTDFRAVMELLKQLRKFPKYLIVISDMEFDRGSNQSKIETMRLFKQYEADTKIVWWNLNDRNKTVPEFDEYGNIFLSGYNLKLLTLLENNFDMTTYIDKILEKYKKDIEYVEQI